MSDQLFRAIFDAALDALIVFDNEHKFVAVNPSACELFGLSCEELLDCNLAQFTLASESEAVQRAWEEFSREGQAQGELGLRRADGTVFEVEFRTTANIAPNRHLSILRPLTERRQAEARQAQLLEEIKTHRTRLEGLLSSVPGVVWEAWGQPDADSQRIDFVSDYIETMLGYSVEEWLSTPNFWLTIVHPDDQQRAAGVAANSFASGTGHIDEFRWMTKDGRAIWVEARAVVIKDADGSSVGMRGVTLDISWRKQMQQALEYSENRFRFLFEQSPMSMQILAPDGETVSVNRAWENLWGVTLDQIQGYNILQDPQLEEKGTTPYLRRAFAGEPTALPAIYYDPRETIDIPDTRARWTRAVAYPIKNKEQITEVVLIHEDITEWKQAERNLHFLLEASDVLSGSLDYEETLKILAEFAVPIFADYCVVDMFEDEAIRRVALAHRDPERIRFVEEIEQKFPPRMDAQAGVPRVRRTGEAEMAREIPIEMIEAAARSEEHLALIRQLKLKSYIVVPLYARDQLLGAISWVREQGSPPYNDADFELAKDLGQRAGIAIENARLYREATESLAAAEAANRAKDEFLAVVSHELRTPLNAISGWASLLRSQNLDASTVSQALEIIERNCYIQNKLVEDILEISRIVGGTLQLERKPVEMSSVVETSSTSIKSLANAKSIHIHLDLEPNLLVDGDEVRLQQVVTNLLSNAIKFTPENGHVEVTLTRSASQAKLSIRDTGQGISPDFLPFVFERFRQADGSSTRRYGGLGLGLAIVRHLVELHGGTINAESAGEGQGATFTIRLPLLQELSFPQNGAEHLDKSTSAGHSLRHHRRTSNELAGLRVLVVDDDPDALILIRLRLEALGADVTISTNTQEALSTLQKGDFSLLISDIAMPDESGYDLIRQIRVLPTSDKAEIAAIALTAFTGAEERENALSAGFQMHLSKPIEFDELTRSILQLCGKQKIDATSDNNL